MIKPFLGGLATAIAFYSYIPYIKNVLRGKTKPHAFSWLIWTTMMTIAFVAQVSGGGAAGTWVSALSIVVCTFIFFMALFKGEKSITKSDWACLFSAGIAIALWVITDGPLLSVILVSIIDAIGCIPTIRKSFHKPHEETAITYFFSGLKYVIAIPALETFSVITVLYPVTLVILNTIIVSLLLIRRNQLAASAVVTPTALAD